MSTTIEGMTVRLSRDDEDPRKYKIVVQCYSQKLPGLKATNDIDPGRSPNQAHLLNLIGVAGAVCAEYLGKKYGDNIDPVAASQFAIRAFGEECRLLAELSKDVPTKLRRLESNVASLNNQHQEQLHRLRWLVDHNQRLVPAEVRWIHERLGELHGNQLG